MLVSEIGIEVIDAHAHFMTYNTVKGIIERSQGLDKIKKRAPKSNKKAYFIHYALRKS